jgi:cytochrome c
MAKLIWIFTLQGEVMRRTLVASTVLMLVLSVSIAFSYTTQQAERGKQIFIQQCASCHGANGEGGVVSEMYGAYAGMKAPPVVGKGMLPNMKTAGNAYAFVKAHMPLQSPGSLSSEEALAVIAFDLMANGIKADGQSLTPESAQKIVLHGE